MVLLCEKYPEEVNLVGEKESNRLGAGKERTGEWWSHSELRGSRDSTSR